MPSKRVRELKQRLDELASSADFDELTTDPEERGVLEEAIRNFRNAGPELLDDATPYLWAYYRSVASAFEADERKEYGIPELTESGDIWDEVEIRSPPELRLGGTQHEPGRSYVSFEGNVSWEVEHGLQLVFEHGERVCKVSPYDGHVTNAHAWNDLRLLGVIFK